MGSILHMQKLSQTLSYYLKLNWCVFYLWSWLKLKHSTFLVGDTFICYLTSPEKSNTLDVRISLRFTWDTNFPHFLILGALDLGLQNWKCDVIDKNLYVHVIFSTAFSLLMWSLFSFLKQHYNFLFCKGRGQL